MKGCTGIVLLVHTSPTIGYTVEFTDGDDEEEDSDTIAVLSVYPSDIIACK
jgi:hypothetical protein